MPIVDTKGARIAWNRQGVGPAVLLIQGAGVPGEGWRPQIDSLSRDWDVIWLDNRGMGGSTRPAGALTIEAMAHDAWVVADAAGVGSIHVVGHSMGGLIAQEMAFIAPQRVSSLALLCTFARGADATRLTAGMIATGLRTRIGTRRMRRHAFLELVMTQAELAQVGRDQAAAHLGALFGRDLADQPAVVMKQLGAMARYDPRPRSAELDGIRTLVVAGGQDRIAFPESGRALAAAIPGARFVRIEDAGHALPIFRAAELQSLLAEHLGQASGELQAAV